MIYETLQTRNGSFDYLTGRGACEGQPSLADNGAEAGQSTDEVCSTCLHHTLQPGIFEIVKAKVKTLLKCKKGT